MSRPFLAVGLFALAVAVAACGGGGNGAAPSIPASAAPAQTPVHYASAILSLKIPAQSAAPSIKRPAYVSPNTQSVQIYAYSVASPSASPSPQTFTVAVPPCTRNSDGSKTCTFNVQAPYGEDDFVIKTYAVPNPSASSVPLAVFNSGAVNVTPAGTPPPLSFTLTGVVASVGIAMQNPDPSTTPSTQIGTVGTAITSSQLLVTPRDASGAAIMTDTFAQAVTVSVTPANAGVSLVLTSNSQCTPASTASGASASITCASDLNKLAFAYSGTIARDSSGNVIDHIAFEGGPQQSGSPAPAFLALQGTTINYSLPYGPLTSMDPFVRFVKNPGTAQTYTYLMEGGGDSVLGQVDLSNPSAAAPATDLGYYAPSMTVDRAGNIWVADTYASTLQCYSSITASPVSVDTVVAPISSPDPVSPDFVTTDTQGNVWFYGPDQFSSIGELGYIPNPSSCSSVLSPNGSIADAGSDSPVDLETAPTGGVFALGQYNIFSATTSSSGSLTPTPLAGGEFGEGLGIDASGNSYTGLSTEGPLSEIALLPHNQSAFTSTLSTLYGTGAPYGVGVNQTGAASTLIYALTDYSNTHGLAVGSASSFSNFAFLPENGPCYAAFVDPNGDAWGLCWTTDPVTQNNVAQLTHVVRTTVWNAMIPSAPFAGQTTLIPIIETGNKGPFTVTASDPTAISTAPPATGYENTIPVTFTGSGSSQVTITVTDAFGRSESLQVSPRAVTVRRRNVKALLRHIVPKAPAP